MIAAHKNIWGIESVFRYTWWSVAEISGYFWTKSVMQGKLMIGCPKVKHMVLAFNSSELMKVLSFHNIASSVQATRPPDENPIDENYRMTFLKY